MKKIIKGCSQENMRKLPERGITLPALVITIIIIIILVFVTIKVTVGEDGIIAKAKQASIAEELSTYKEQLELYKTNKFIENNKFTKETLTAGKNNLIYDTKPEEEIGNIKTIIPSLNDAYLDKIEVIKGELLLNTQDITEIKAAQSLGIEINPYIIENGVLISADNNLVLMDKNTGTLTIPDSVTVIGAGAFANLEGLKTIIIPSTVKSIEENAFRNNVDLETVIMQEKVKEDGTIEGVEFIGSNAFAWCSNLITVKMANTVKETGSQVFYNDSKLQNINLSNNLKVINTYMFSNCNITEIEIPEGVNQINSNAFSACKNLETIKLPSTLQTISGNTFVNCINLKNIEINSENKNFTFNNGILLGNDKTEMIIILEDAIVNNTFEIPDTVTALRTNQIAQYTQITTVLIPKSVITIDGLFFNNNITNVIIDDLNPMFEIYENAIYTKSNSENEIQMIRYYGSNNSVKVRNGTERINRNCFKNSNLTQIELPDSLKAIESEAFSGCQNLKSIKLGADVNEFNAMSIYNTGIEEIIVSEDNQNYSIREGNICNGEKTKALYNKDGSVFIAPIKPLGSIETYEIKSVIDGTEVKKIAGNAFHNQNKMNNIIIPNTIEKIENSFNYCNSLQKIEIPNSVKEINIHCFSNSTNLKEIIIHNTEGSIKGEPWGCIYADRAIFWLEN